jgi:hypothetical protein
VEGSAVFFPGHDSFRSNVISATPLVFRQGPIPAGRRALTGADDRERNQASPWGGGDRNFAVLEVLPTTMERLGVGTVDGARTIRAPVLGILWTAFCGQTDTLLSEPRHLAPVKVARPSSHKASHYRCQRSFVPSAWALPDAISTKMINGGDDFSSKSCESSPIREDDQILNFPPPVVTFDSFVRAVTPGNRRCCRCSWSGSRQYPAWHESAFTTSRVVQAVEPTGEFAITVVRFWVIRP